MNDIPAKYSEDPKLYAGENELFVIKHPDKLMKNIRVWKLQNCNISLRT